MISATGWHIVAEVDSIYYGLALLRSRLVHGALIATGRGRPGCRRREAPGRSWALVLIPLAPGFSPPLQILAGIFARKGERALYHPEHPLNLLWEAFNIHLHGRPQECPRSDIATGE